MTRYNCFACYFQYFTILIIISLYFYFVSKQQEILIMQGVCDASQSKYHEEAIIAMQTLVIFDKHMCKFMNVKNVLF